MVKSGKERSNKFNAKHDPETIMLRIKALQNFSIKGFTEPAQQHAYVDENIAEWIAETPLPFGKRGVLLDFVKQIAWKWAFLPDVEKEFWHQKWFEAGFPEDLWQRIDAKNSEIIKFRKTYKSHNIIVSYETDVFPYPDEDVNPKDQDYVLNDEVNPSDVEVYTQNVWRQKGISFGHVDYMYVWSEAKMDETLPINTTYEMVQPLIYDKTIKIFAHITEPYQSPLDRTPVLSTSYETENGETEKASKPLGLTTSNVNSQLASPSKTSNINISYDTQVTP